MLTSKVTPTRNFVNTKSSFSTSGEVGPTDRAFSCKRPPRPNGRAGCGCRQSMNSAICSRRDAVKLEMPQALQRRANERPLVGCYAELGRRTFGGHQIPKAFFKLF